MITWPELLELYLEAHRQRLAPLTLRRDRLLLSRVVAFLADQGASEPGALAPVHCDALGHFFREGSKRTAFSRLRPFLRWAARRGHVPLDPTPDLVLPPQGLSQKPLLTLGQVEALLAAPDRGTPHGMRDAAVLETFYGTGIRLSECLGLDLFDLDLAHRTLTLRLGKPRKDRVQPLGDQLAEVLARYVEEARPRLQPFRNETALFLGNRRRRISRERIFYLTRHYSQSAGLPHVTSHVLRHNFAVHLLEGGANIESVRRLLGHVMLQTTQVYTKIRPLELQFEHHRTHPTAKKRRQKRSTAMSWDAVNTYQEYLLQEGRSPSSREQGRYWVGLFAGHCQELRLETLDQVAPHHLDEFHQKLLWTVTRTGRMYAPNTVAIALNTVRSFLRWAHRQGYLALDPSRQLVLPKAISLQHNLPTAAEVQRLLDTPDAGTPIGLRDRLILELLYSVELNATACVALDLADVSLGDGSLRRSIPAPAQRFPMRTRLQAVVQRYLVQGRPYLTSKSATPALILGQTGQRLLYIRILQIVRQHAAVAGLQADLNARLLRRAYLEQCRAAAQPISSYLTTAQRGQKRRRRTLPGN